MPSKCEKCGDDMKDGGWLREAMKTGGLQWGGPNRDGHCMCGKYYHVCEWCGEALTEANEAEWFCEEEDCTYEAYAAKADAE